MAPGQWLGEGLGPTKPWGPGQPPLPPHTGQCSRRYLRVYVFLSGAGGPMVEAADQGKAQQLGGTGVQEACISLWKHR